ncbi:MAG TPA: metalloregulator ArsR/SmtB family transcription factor [Pseudonocardiaceae bacterium]|nr:metalloregulator ArsR/SmtB family transcription factor [Pseudonocardiaceae bacterium]
MGENEKGARGDIDLSAVGALLADPSRCRMLFALDDGRQLAAGHLADEAGVTPSTASTHLHKLVAAGLVTGEQHGRHRYYRLAGLAVARLLESITAVAPRRPVRSLRDGTRAQRLRLARSCYDHLAGRLGVAVMGSLLAEGHLTGHDGTIDPDRLSGALSGGGDDTNYTVTAGGERFFADLGITNPGRLTVRCCIDWSEQRHHLSGQLGRAVFRRFLNGGWIRRGRADRTISVTDGGVRELRERFGVDFAALR